MKKGVAVCFLVLFFIAMFYFGFSGGSSVDLIQLDFFDKVVAALGVFGAFGFWFMMLADFFKNDRIRHKVAWGFFMIFFSWVASGIYFFKYFMPRRP